MSADGDVSIHNFSQFGRHKAPQQRYDLVVVGAGEAGLAAATAAAKAGRSVLVVDEHPLDPGLIGLDVPYLFGGRATNAVQTPDRLVEQIFAARPALEAAAEAGVELELGVSCWGLYVNGPNLQTLASPVIGLANLETAWMVGFDQAVIATGARDLVLGFPGWDQPGVMGAAACPGKRRSSTRSRRLTELRRKLISDTRPPRAACVAGVICPIGIPRMVMRSSLGCARAASS